MQPPLLQPAWDAILLHGQGLVDHRLFPALLGLVAFVVTCLGFTWKDLRRRAPNKINPERWPSARDIARAAVPQLLVYVAGNAVGWHMLAGRVELPSAAPGLAQVFVEAAACLVVADFLIYWEHRLMHAIPVLKRHVHSVHHSYAYPFSWAGGWVHPLEDAVVIACVLAPVHLFGVHPFSFWVFLVAWVAFVVEEHSGYDVFWSPYRWLPFSWGGGGAPHDPHHNLDTTRSFGFVFGAWDQLFGTHVPLPESEAKRQRLRARGSAA